MLDWKNLKHLKAYQQKIETLFTPINFCFVTKDPKRTPTFYFAEGGLGKINKAKKCGRIRTEHPKGPLIDITTSQKSHFFFKDKKDRNNLKTLVKAARSAPSAGTDKMILFKGIEMYNGSAGSPQNKYHHFEYTYRNPTNRIDPIHRLHSSGGTVRLLGANKPTQNQIDLILTRLDEVKCGVSVNGKKERICTNVNAKMDKRIKFGWHKALVTYLKTIG